MSKKLACWWLGHKTDSQATGYNGYSFFWVCHWCRQELDYTEFADRSRYEAAKELIRYWLFRKWLPAKCSYCGHRYKCDETKDHIPF